MRNFKRFYFLLLFFVTIITNAHAQYLISGAANPDVNGIYLEKGTENGKPYYSNGSCKLVYYDGFTLKRTVKISGSAMKWVVMKDYAGKPSSPVYYSTSIDGDLPPNEGWHKGYLRDASAGNPIIVAKINSIAYDKNVFVEAASDDGHFKDTVNILLYSPENPFTGANDEDFVATGKLVVNNLPAGITPVVKRTSDTTLMAIFTGAATNHTKNDNIDNLTFAFQNSAFADRDASEIENSTKTDLKIMFMEKYIVFDATENVEVNDIFLLTGLFNQKPYYTNGNYNINYRGCGAKWVLVTSSGGSCPEYSTAIDGDNIPAEGWYDGGEGGGSSDTIYISPTNTIFYNKNRVLESMLDDGSIDDSIMISFVAPADNNKFTGTNGDDFITDGKILVSNLPAGLTAIATRTGDTTLTVKFTGNAESHNYLDNINNLSFEFQNTAFVNDDVAEINNYLKSDISILFWKKYEVIDAISTPEVNGTYFSTGENNGNVVYSKGEYRLGYRGCGSKWVIVDGDDDNNVEEGYCPLYSTGVVSDVVPYNGWAVGGYDRDYSETIYVIPHNYILYNSNCITESLTDDGSINDTLALTYFFPSGGNKFTGNNGDDFVTDGKILISNLPSGLTAIATRTSDTTITIKFTGNAVSHGALDNINNLSFEFQNSAFVNGDTTEVENYLKNDVDVVFIMKYEVSDAIDEPGMNGTYVSSGTFNGKPIFSNGEYRLGYRGCYTKWVIVDGDLDNNVAGGYCPLSRTYVDGDLPPLNGWENEAVRVYPHNSILYNSNNIRESLSDDGTIDDTLALTYFFPSGGNKFTGNNGDDFIADGKIFVSNLPAGLTAIATRTGDTTLTVKFTGAASNHRFSDNIDDLTFEFQNSAFTDGNAGVIINYLKNDIGVVFIMKYEVFNAVNNPEINGTYVSAGYFKDKPFFSKGDSLLLGYRGCSDNVQWVIIDSDDESNLAPDIGFCPIERNYENSDFPPMEGWGDNAVRVYPHNSLYYEKTTFKESLVNDGSIDNSDTLVIRYFFPAGSATFSGVNDEDFVAEGKVTLTNLPVGLTAVVTRKSDTTLAVVLTGNTCSEDVNDLTFAFSDNAFTGITAEEVFYSTKEDLKINFHNNYYVASTGGDFTTISEAVADEEVKDGDVIIISDETFTVTNEINVNKALTFIGQGAGKTIIQANANPATANYRLFHMSFDYNNYKNVSFQNMTIQNGSVGSYGGAIYLQHCNLTIKNCEIKNNRTTSNRGGAIYLNYGNFVAENTTFSNNFVVNGTVSSSYGGGAIYFQNISDSALISNCTFSDNSVGGMSGGAIWSNDNLKITNSTFANNSAKYGGGIYIYSGTIDMVNVLVADNTATASGNDIYGSGNVNADYCLIEDVTGATITGANNVTGSDPELVALADNGGSTQTCAISSTSPAKDAGTNENVPLIDQRGVEVFNTTKDIGSYEFNSEPAIMVSDTVIDFGSVMKDETAELSYTLSAINLSENLVVTAPSGFEISANSGSEFVGESTITITPQVGFVSDTIIYVQCTSTTSGNFEDIITNESTDAETMNITVKSNIVNRPIGEDDSVVVVENTEKVFATEDFTFNDEDGDIFSGIKIITKETNGDLEYDGINVSDGYECSDISKITFKPFENESGLAYAIFTFKLKDNTGFYSDSVYTMTIDVNDIPEGANDIVSTNEDVDLTFAAEDFTFTNTVGGFEGIQIVSVQTAGTLQYDGADVAADMDCPDVTKLVFTPVANANGDAYATFEFNVKDDLGVYSEEAYTMTINVTAVNDAPEGANDVVTTSEDVDITFATADFTYMDVVEGDAFAGINIVS
ncbi:MAG: hypothetical protein DRJ01_09910, partial [Bacteroidetes bacterium]